MSINVTDVIDALKLVSHPEDVKMMASFGINPANALGVRMPEIRKIAKQLKKQHHLGLELYATGIHEGKILASMLIEPALLSEKEMDNMVSKFDSWDVCDQCCGGLLIFTPFSTKKIEEYAKDEREFVRRAAFVLMTYHFIKSKKYDDTHIDEFLKLTIHYSFDKRTYVKKAISWALRQMGKSANNKHIEKVLETSYLINNQPYASAKWIASDVSRELKSKL